jgi:hypothetical protein
MKLGVIFEASFEKFDKTSTAPAFASLRQQILDYAEALKKDPNVIVLDSFFVTTPGDYANRTIAPADSHIATLKAQQAVAFDSPVQNVPVIPGPPMTSLPKPKPAAQTVAKSAIVEGIKMESITGGPKFDTRRGSEEVQPVAKPAGTSVMTDARADELLAPIFANLKKTAKSVAILRAMAKAEEASSVSEIMAATGLGESDVRSWIGTTAKAVKPFHSPARGEYGLDFTKS